GGGGGASGDTGADDDDSSAVAIRIESQLPAGGRGAVAQYRRAHIILGGKRRRTAVKPASQHIPLAAKARFFVQAESCLDQALANHPRHCKCRQGGLWPTEAGH